MEDVGSLISAVALWIGISCSLWWLHRRRTHGRQDRQLQQSRRAVELADKAPAIFDAIRTPVAVETAARDEAALLRAATHALLKRIQEQGSFFDTVNNLRVQIQASIGVEDHPALSDILHLRRDFWAASEILLVEDPASLGTTFAEPGAYERICDEAVDLLFKSPDQRAGEDDAIGLRLSLARDDAAAFVTALEAAIHEAREKDRLPTWSEVVAYPLGFFRAIPGAVRTAFAFIRAFIAYSADSARAIRQSDTAARGASRLQQAREDWPQRLSAGFERASGAARGGGANLRRHYDFLVTAYDFQTKYEEVLRRAPDLTERGRQFIVRLELAEKSERLRLTSANAAIWVARRMLDGLAHLIAALQRLAAALSETRVWGLGEALMAPVPSTGRQTASFRSYEMALRASGLREDKPQPLATSRQLAKPAIKPKATAKGQVAPQAKTGKVAPSAPPKAARKSSKAAGAAPKPASAPAARSKKAAAIAAKSASLEPASKPPVKAAAPKLKDIAAPAATGPASSPPSAASAQQAARRWRFAIFATKNETSLAARAKQLEKVPESREKLPLAPSATAAGAREKKAALKPIPINAPKAVGNVPAAEQGTPAPAAAQPQIIPPPQPAAAREASPPPAPPPAPVAAVAPAPKRIGARDGAESDAPPRETARPPRAALTLEDFDYTPPPPNRGSFLGRLFGTEARRQRKAQAEAEQIAAALAEAVTAGELAAPLDEKNTARTLMAKLSSLMEADAEPAGPQEEMEDAADDPDIEANLAEEPEAEEADEPGPLTLSILELRAKIEPKAPNIRSFPWLRE